MMLDDVLQIAGGMGGGALGTVIIYLRLIGQRLDRIDDRLHRISDRAQDHEYRLRELEAHAHGRRA